MKAIYLQEISFGFDKFICIGFEDVGILQLKLQDPPKDT